MAECDGKVTRWFARRKIFSTIMDDFTVAHVLLLNNAKLTSPVIDGMARWFRDVELELPLPVMIGKVR